MTSVSPASIGDQAIARVDRQWVGRSEKRAQERRTAKRRCTPVFEQWRALSVYLAKWPINIWTKNYGEVDAGCDR